MTPSKYHDQGPNCSLYTLYILCDSFIFKAMIAYYSQMAISHFRTMKNYSSVVNHVSNVKAERISVYPHNNIVCPLPARS